MKAIEIIGLIAQMQPPFVGFQPMIQQQQQAKSGVVTLKHSTDPDWPAVASQNEETPIQEIAAVDPLRATVGQLSVEALRAAVESKGVMVKITNDLGDRRVTIVPTTAIPDGYTLANAIAGTDAAGDLTFDGGEKNNAPMTNAVANGTGLSTAINTELATRKPSFSLASIINTVEDAVISDEATDALIFVDQDTGHIRVLTGAPAAILAAEEAALAGMDVNEIFAQNATPQAASEKLLGE